MILVIGATGTVGRKVVAQLSESGAPVRALARDPKTANLPSTVDVIRGDVTLPDTLEPALGGVDAAFIVWVAPLPAFAPAFERIARRVPRLVFLSAPVKTPHPFFQQPNASRERTLAIEGQIEASGVEWVFVRPSMFADNALHFWGPQFRAGNVVQWPYLAAPTAPIDARDIAAVAVHGLLDRTRSTADYVITGPESLTQQEQIEIIARTAGRNPAIQEVTRDEACRGCMAAFPTAVADLLMNAWQGGLGQPAYVTQTVAEVTGRPARTFREWAADYAPVFATGNSAATDM